MIIFKSLHQKLDLIIQQNNALLRRTNTIVDQQRNEMVNLDALKAQLEAETNAVTAAVNLITTLAAEISAASGDQAAIDALAAQFATQAQTLAEAVAANTPAAPVV